MNEREGRQIRYGFSCKSNFLMEGKTMGVGRYKLSVLWGVDRGMSIIWERLKYGIVEVSDSYFLWTWGSL